MNLFVYGTLMDAQLVVRLTGRRFSAHPARLVGYRKLTPRGGYPYIAGDPDGVVDGVLLTGVDAAALRAIDAYEEEGRLYRRTVVSVAVAERRTQAMTYVGIPAAFTDRPVPVAGSGARQA